MRILAVPACLLVMAAPSLHSQAAPTTKPATLQWGPAPAVFPKGATMAVVLRPIAPPPPGARYAETP